MILIVNITTLNNHCKPNCGDNSKNKLIIIILITPADITSNKQTNKEKKYRQQQATGKDENWKAHTLQLWLCTAQSHTCTHTYTGNRLTFNILSFFFLYFRRIIILLFILSLSLSYFPCINRLLFWQSVSQRPKSWSQGSVRGTIKN